MVTYVAKDRSGNAASCNVYVTVNGKKSEYCDIKCIFFTESTVTQAEFSLEVNY